MTWAGVAAPILYATGAALILRLGHRFVRPLSRRAALALAALPLLFVGPALLTGRIYAPFNLAYATEPLSALAPTFGLDDHERYPRRGILGDVNSQMLPWRAAVRHAWGLGEWPLWNPFMLAGDPLAGSAQAAPYDPIHLGSLLLPLGASWTPAAGLRLLVTALAMFFLLRRLGCRESVAVAGGAAWTFSSFCAFWHGWPLGATLGLLPLLLEMVERTIERPDRGAVLRLGAVLALAILAGHPESLAYLVPVAGVWAVVRLGGHGGGWTHRARVAGAGLAAGLIAGAVTAFFLAPFVDVLEQTDSWRQRGIQQARLHASEPWPESGRSLVRTLLPPLDAARSAWLGQHPTSGYAGSLLWVPVVLACGRRGPRRDVVLLCAGLGVCGLLLASRFPGATEGVAWIPLLNRALSQRLAVLVPFALTVLAALGLEAWRTDPAPAPATARWARAHGILLAGALALAALVYAQPPASERDRALAVAAAGWALAPLLAATLLAVGLRRRPELVFAGFVALLLAQRTGEMSRFYPTLPAAAFFPRPAIFAPLPGAGAPYRVVGAHFAMVPNTSAHWQLEDPRGFQPTLHWRFAQVEPLWTNSEPPWGRRIDDLTSPWLRFLNVRYAVTGAEPAPAGWSEIARHPGDGPRLLQSERALPRAFVPRRVRFVDAAGRAAALAEMAPLPAPAERAWVEPGAGRERGGRSDVRNARGDVSIERRGSGYRLRTRLDRAGWVVVSVTAWRGWRAMDRQLGAEVPLGFANHAFLAVPVAGGGREVELRYVPRSFLAGLLVSVATWLGLVLWLARPPLASERGADEARGRVTVDSNHG